MRAKMLGAAARAMGGRLTAAPAAWSRQAACALHSSGAAAAAAKAPGVCTLPLTAFVNLDSLELDGIL